MKKKTKGTKTSEAEIRKDITTATEPERMVYGYDEKDGPWKELTTVLNISKSGAGFTVSRPCTVGRLIELKVPLTKELRALADPEIPDTAVGLVQYCQPSKAGSAAGYNVGVVFVGQEFPETYFDNPGQTYRITGRDDSGMWSITETDAAFTTRAAPRFAVRLDVAVALLRKDRKTPRYKEDTYTYDVGVSGACVASGLSVGIGDRVKFASDEHKFYAVALVKNRSRRNSRLALHLEFVDAKYPVEKLPPTSPHYYEPETDESPEEAPGVNRQQKGSRDARGPSR